MTCPVSGTVGGQDYPWWMTVCSVTSSPKVPGVQPVTEPASLMNLFSPMLPSQKFLIFSYDFSFMYSEWKKICSFNSSSGWVIYLFIWLYLIHCIRVSVKLICTYSPLGGYMQKITKITHGKSMIEQPHGHKPRTTKNRHRCLRVCESSSKYFSVFIKLGSPGSIRYTVKYKWRCLRLRC